MKAKVTVSVMLVALAVFCVYSVVWINVGYEERRALKTIISDVEVALNRNIYYSEIAIGGYPFKFNTVIKGLRVKGNENNGTYEFNAGDVSISSDLLLRDFVIDAGENMGYVIAVDDEVTHIFHTGVSYKPHIEVTLVKSLLRNFFADDQLNKFMLAIDKIKYRDVGYKMFDEEKNIIYANNGFNKVDLVSYRSKNKHNGEVSRDVKFFVDLNVRSERLADIDTRLLNNMPFVVGRPFHVHSAGEFRVPVSRFTPSGNNIYIDLSELSYVDEDYHLSIQGTGGLIPRLSMLVGEFTLSIANYEKFFNDALIEFFPETKQYTAIKNKILDISNRKEDGVLYITYRADDVSGARIGKVNLKEFFEFAMSTLDISSDDILKLFYPRKEEYDK